MRRLISTASIAGSFTLLAGVLAMLSGCGKFFSPVTTTTTCTTDCTTTSDYFYVANERTAGPGIAAFSIANSALSVQTASPYALTVLPTTIAITPSNSFLYVGSSDGPLYLYAINSDGTLTIQNSGNAVATIPTTSMQVDATGSWLVVANAASPSVSVYAIDSTTGLLTVSNTSPTSLNGGTGIPSRLVLTPNNLYTYVSLGTSGVEVMTFNASTGALTDAGNLKPRAANDSNQGLAVDSASKFLFVTETGISAVRVLTIGANGLLTEVSGSPYATGTGPSSVLVDGTASYVYVTNQTDNTVSAFLLTNSGSLTEIAGSPYATGTTPIAITEDKSSTYVAVVCEGGSPDVELFTFDATTSGKLDGSTALQAVTGTDPTIPVAIAATH